MRKEYGKALRETFAHEMRARLPEFELLKTASKYLFPGERVYHRRPLDSVLCIVILVPSRKDTDEFTVEIGWSKRGRFPELGMRPCGEPSGERAEFDHDEFVCRLPQLWTREDVWWPIGATARLDLLDPEDQVAALLAMTTPISPDDAKAAVQAPVEDVMARISTHAVPYLDEFARSQGGAP
jgi:hypothetical protein